jgi:hypothetical protein
MTPNLNQRFTLSLNLGQASLIVRSLDLLEHQLRSMRNKPTNIITQLKAINAMRQALDFYCGVNDSVTYKS